MRGLRPAVFFDRDGTLTEEVGYVNHISRLKLLPFAARAIRSLNEARLPAFVVTNQSGVGQGYFPEELVELVHEKIRQDLAAAGARIEAFYYCPHHPQARLMAYRRVCRCRKPDTGLMERAAREFGIDLEASYAVGDSTRDMEMGAKAGARTVLVLTGYGRGNLEYQRDRWNRMPDFIVENALEAVEKILEESSRRAAPGLTTAGRP